MRMFNTLNKYLIAQTFHLLGNIKKNLYLLLIFVSFEEFFCFAKIVFFYFSTIEYIYVDI